MNNVQRKELAKLAQTRIAIRRRQEEAAIHEAWAKAETKALDSKEYKDLKKKVAKMGEELKKLFDEAKAGGFKFHSPNAYGGSYHRLGEITAPALSLSNEKIEEITGVPSPYNAPRTNWEDKEEEVLLQIWMAEDYESARALLDSI